MNKDYVLMPKTLTAENRALLSGEFCETGEYVDAEISCNACGGSGSDGSGWYFCDECNGTGASGYVKLPVTWDTIKAIYDKAVKEFSREVNDEQ